MIVKTQCDKNKNVVV